MFVGDTNCFLEFVLSPYYSGLNPLWRFSTAWIVTNEVESDIEMNSEVSLLHCRGPSVNVNV